MISLFEKTTSAFLVLAVTAGPMQPLRTEASTTAPAEFLRQVQLEGESIFGKNGCASIDEKGNVSYVSQTTRNAVESLNEDAPASIDCAERIIAYSSRYKKAQALIAEHDANLREQESGIKNENCTDCTSTVTSASALQDPENQCSETEKKSLSHQRKNDPQCGMSCELKGSLKKSLNQASFGLLGGLVKSSPSCNTDKAGTSPFGCLSDFVISLFSSLSSMCKAVWDGAVSAVKSAKNWVVGLFSSHARVEEAATQTSPAFANMSDEEIRAAQKNPDKANQNLLAKIGNGFNFILENIVGLDTPVYSELWQCSKCGERLGAICKIAGVVGKDVIKNAILIWIGGKAIQGIAQTGKAALKLASKTGKSTSKWVAKTSTGRSLLKWGSVKTASLSEKTANTFRSFMATKVGKYSAFAAGMSSAALLKTLKTAGKAAGTVFESIDKAMMMPIRISVRSGKSVLSNVKSAINQTKLYARTPILTAEEATRTGIKSLKELPSNVEMHLEIPSPVTPAMEKSKSFLNSKLKGKNAKAFTDDIENANEVLVQTTNPRTIQIETHAGPKFIRVDQADKVTKVHAFGDDASKTMIVMSDGKIHLANQGKVIKTFSDPKDLEKINPLLGQEAAAADRLALQEIKTTAELNGVAIKDAVASTEIKAIDEFKVQAPKACGDTPITFGGVAR